MQKTDTQMAGIQMTGNQAAGMPMANTRKTGMLTAEIQTAGNRSKKTQLEKMEDHWGQAADNKGTGARLELDSLVIEYHNLFDRSNKLDNKVYITITFCGFLFVFITGLFSGISQLRSIGRGPEAVVAAAYILTCMAVMVSYVYLLIYFMRLLQPEQIVRMDPDILQAAGLGDMGDEDACRQLIEMYRATINEDLAKLKNRCNEFTKGLRFVVPTVILAFVAYGLQLLVQVM